MVKRVCPICGEAMLSAAAEKEWTCPVCGAKVGPLLNTTAEGRAYPVVGQLLPGGFEVMAAYMNQHILVHSLEKKNSFMVLSLNPTGEFQVAEFFEEAISAERCFAERCFRWFKRSQVNVITPAVDPEASAFGVMVDMGRMNDKARCRTTLEYTEKTETVKGVCAILRETH